MTTPGHDPPVAEAGNDLVCLLVSRQLALSPQTGYIVPLYVRVKQRYHWTHETHSSRPFLANFRDENKQKDTKRII